MPRGYKPTPMQRVGFKANQTATQGGSPFKRNNAQGTGGMNLMPAPAPTAYRRGGSGGPRGAAQARTAALVGKVGDAITDSLPAWKGTVDNGADPTSALSMARRKAASAAGPVVNGKAGTVGNGVINK